MRMSEICTANFFVLLSALVGGEAGQFISDYSAELEMDIAKNFNVIAIDEVSEEQGARWVAMKYATNITRAYDAMYAEYNPLANMQMTEKVKHTGEDTTNKNIDETTAYSGTDILSHKGTDTRTNSGEQSASGSETYTVTTYGGTMSKPVQTSSSNGESNASATESATYGRAEETTYGREKNLSGTDSIIVNYNNAEERERQGNIGVTTNQHLIEEEMLMRFKYNFADFVVVCIMKTLSGGVWSD